MSYHLGTRVLVNQKQPGVISEIVPPNATPRSIPHRAAWRRPVVSYVVTVLASRTMQLRGGGPNAPTGRVPTLSCRRIWPNPASVALRSGSAF